MRINADAAALAVGFVLHHSTNLGKEGPVTADTDVHARMDLSAALTDQYGACVDGLAAVALNATSLPVAIATI
jgi:hypothetical protein